MFCSDCKFEDGESWETYDAWDKNNPEYCIKQWLLQEEV